MNRARVLLRMAYLLEDKEDIISGHALTKRHLEKIRSNILNNYPNKELKRYVVESGGKPAFILVHENSKEWYEKATIEEFRSKLIF